MRHSTPESGPSLRVEFLDEVGARRYSGAMKKSLPEMQRLVHIVSRLRKECPWDRKQTHRSLLPYLIEEAHEAYDAIQSKKTEPMREELGDLLLQIVLHSELASETKSFDLEGVAKAISDKMVRRHPHVFDKKNYTAQGHSQRWIALKQKEKPNRTLLSGVPKSLPGLQVASRYGEIAGSVGFDWPDAPSVLDKVKEEYAEFLAEYKKGKRAKKQMEEELGDLFFSLSNLARHLEIDPEACAKKGTQKFFRRFTAMEKRLAKAGRDSTKLSPAEWEAEWQKAKR